MWHNFQRAPKRDRTQLILQHCREIGILYCNFGSSLDQILFNQVVRTKKIYQLCGPSLAETYTAYVDYTPSNCTLCYSQFTSKMLVFYMLSYNPYRFQNQRTSFTRSKLIVRT
ncbi:Hypothetical_protein [Hexamita inflata]|uniref:Hypothetical_protein n=1 Tax=Hexamita inflata TaxID=28002 RepID=A0AA86QX08_9EUKA|nr:Hypothetical protein HINF_LOCUS53351 [Hexamita inflata]CAI9965708.1 Hypothetical protein HINF_LOCUS53353 [Hexamita inflata]